MVHSASSIKSKSRLSCLRNGKYRGLSDDPFIYHLYIEYGIPHDLILILEIQEL